MKNSDLMLKNSDFKRAVNTEFARLLIDNNVKHDIIIKYFEQDYFFVLEDLNVLKKLEELSSNNKNMFSWFISLIKNDEIKFFEEFFHENNVNINNIEISPATKKYIDYMEKILAKNNFLCILSMLLAGEWVYLETFSGKNSNNKYINEWEKLHSNDLKRFVDFMKNIIDNSEINNNILKVFNDTVNLEIEFFCQFI